MNNPVTALEACELTFAFGKNVVLDKVSLAVGHGKFVALLGPNGAGKTTLFSLITGLYSARGGSVKIGGFDLRRETLKALACIGVVFQRPTVDLDLSVLQNLRYAADLQGLARIDARQRMAEGINLHGLVGMEKRKVGSLSGGQRRRVELARALMHKPGLLLLDEPTVGLDMQSRNEFVRHVRLLCRENQTGVLWATHLMDEVDLNDDLVLIKKGVVLAKGKTSDLIAQENVDDLSELYNNLVGQAA